MPDYRKWKLISQPGHTFVHFGPEFSEAEIWVVPKARLEEVERELKEVVDRNTGGPHSVEWDGP
jgi:hypothetical protein